MIKIPANIDDNVHFINTSGKIREYHHLLAKLICKYTKTGEKVLDVGCSIGLILNLVNQIDPTLNLYGSDICEDFLKVTKLNLDKVNTILMNENYFDIHSLGNGYNTCVMCHSLEHMKCPLEVITRLMAIIQPGGTLILAVPNPIRPKVIVGNLFRKHYVNKGHVYAWDRSHWINFLENIANLNVIEYPVDEVDLLPKSIELFNFLRPLEIFLVQLFPWFSTSNIAVIRKDESSA